jgi:hypothetical protein
VFGGPYQAWYPHGRPDWYKDCYGAGRLPGENARALYPHEYISGSNLFVRRDLFSIAGDFDPRLGMIGARKRYGEETEFQNAIKRARPEAMFYYDPGLTLLHGIRAHKMNLFWLAHDHFIRGRYAHLGHSTPPKWPSNLREVWEDVRAFFGSAAGLLKALCVGLPKRDPRMFQFPQNYVFEQVFPHAWAMGESYERIARWMRLARSRARPQSIASNAVVPEHRRR